MKTLGKLKINSAKMLNNEELLNLRGGYGEQACHKDGDGCSGPCEQRYENGHWVNQTCTKHTFTYGGITGFTCDCG